MLGKKIDAAVRNFSNSDQVTVIIRRGAVHTFLRPILEERSGFADVESPNSMGFAVTRYIDSDILDEQQRLHMFSPLHMMARKVMLADIRGEEITDLEWYQGFLATAIYANLLSVPENRATITSAEGIAEIYSVIRSIIDSEEALETLLRLTQGQNIIQVIMDALSDSSEE